MPSSIVGLNDRPEKQLAGVKNRALMSLTKQFSANLILVQMWSAWQFGYSHTTTGEKSMSARANIALVAIFSLLPCQGNCGLLADGVIQAVQQGTGDYFELSVVGSGMCAAPLIIKFERSDYQQPGRAVTAFDRAF